MEADFLLDVLVRELGRRTWPRTRSVPLCKRRSKWDVSPYLGKPLEPIHMRDRCDRYERMARGKG